MAMIVMDTTRAFSASFCDNEQFCKRNVFDNLIDVLQAQHSTDGTCPENLSFNKFIVAVTVVEAGAVNLSIGMRCGVNKRLRHFCHVLSCYEI